MAGGGSSLNLGLVRAEKLPSHADGHSWHSWRGLGLRPGPVMLAGPQTCIPGPGLQADLWWGLTWDAVPTASPCHSPPCCSACRHGE